MIKNTILQLCIQLCSMIMVNLQKTQSQIQKRRIRLLSFEGLQCFQEEQAMEALPQQRNQCWLTQVVL